MNRNYQFLCIIIISLQLSSYILYSNEYAPYTSTGSSTEVKRENLCAKFQTSNGWSKGYSIQANIIKGAELNRRTKSFDYDALSTYSTIFWSDDQVSVIRLKSFFGSFSVYGTEGVDQRGNGWELSKSSYCF